ncbi:MAG: HAMP domain-containing histidine kinase [Actinomycetota bacterium]|nr:HAMP domain-containing histidine kinase [Actinomycetota bacterium]
MRAPPVRSLRGRLALLAAGAVALAVALVCVASYLVVRGNLRQAIDASLQGPPSLPTALPSFASRDLDGVTPRTLQLDVQQIEASGRVLASPGAAELPVTALDRRIARSGGTVFTDRRDSSGAHVRVVTRGSTGGDALMLGRPLTETDRALSRLRWLLFLVGGLGVLVSGGLGLLVARAGMAPVDRLTAAAERIARTERPDPPIPVEGTDEIARLGKAFNAMVSALARSRDRQRHLVLDASHELRTPVTVMQTNIELLRRAEDHPGRLRADQRLQLLADLDAQAHELAELVGQLLVMAREDGNALEQEPIDLADVVGRAVERVRLRAPAVTFTVDTIPTPLSGDPLILERAVVNVLDNAVKFGPLCQNVHVTLRNRTLQVQDQGPGVAAEDRAHVFDRFYRATSSRQLPGSGLGLAIVAQAMALHGGTASISGTTQGGTVLRLTFPH